MEERSTFESDEFTLTDANQPKPAVPGKKRSLSDAADESPSNMPPEETKEGEAAEDLSPEEAQRRTDELIQKMLAEDQMDNEPDQEDMEELDLQH